MIILKLLSFILIADFNLLSCEVVFIYKALTVPCGKSKIVSFATSRMKNVVVSPARSKFPIKLIC